MAAPNPDPKVLGRAVALLARRRIAVLTGAGVSTDSGLPDYRGAGSPPRHPMTIAEFRASAAARRRYWAGSQRGWRLFSGARPNTGHRALALLGRAGAVTGVATQNVDGLHLAAGSRKVVPLHGTMHRVVCLTCGQVFARDAVAERIRRDNPWFDDDVAQLAPDGDAEVGDVERFVVPSCTVCGGILKPEVVFFGETIPRDVFRLASSLVAASDALLVVGSSLVVNSGIRVLEQARRRRLPVVIVNRGATRGDGRAVVKLDAGASQTLAVLCERLVPGGNGIRTQRKEGGPRDKARSRAPRADRLEPRAAHPRLERHPA
ncbi:MAG TPA: Sir2 family NAD-dependent protein deacetylase [Microbacteriaceae bacterium]|nr:Sir2 family NAD-dependent protein deacetylase [Microbacteriaceae bacterium]